MILGFTEMRTNKKMKVWLFFNENFTRRRYNEGNFYCLVAIILMFVFYLENVFFFGLYNRVIHIYTIQSIFSLSSILFLHHLHPMLFRVWIVLSIDHLHISKGCHHMVVGFTTTYVISVLHHWVWFQLMARCLQLSTNKTDCHDITEILLKWRKATNQYRSLTFSFRLWQLFILL
jgi:hypothetical protein